jgi:hypothetical protein
MRQKGAIADRSRRIGFAVFLGRLSALAFGALTLSPLALRLLASLAGAAPIA